MRIVNPDGTQRRTMFGVAPALADPDTVEPSPWAVTGYDENDLASVATNPAGAPLTHHWTPTTTVLDGLGRTVCQVARAGALPETDWYAVRTRHDLRGNVLSVEDQLGRTAFAHAYDLTDRPLRVDNLDAGTTWSVFDAAGNLLEVRDARGCLSLRTYDPLNRASRGYARDLPEAELTLREVIEHGDGGTDTQTAAARATARAANRLGRLWRQHDGAGLLTVGSYDFVGNPIDQTRQVIGDDAIAAAEPAGWTADWAAPGAEAALDPAEYRTTSRFDGLGRAIEIVAPADVTGHRARIAPDYGRSGALLAVAVDAVPYVRLIVYDANGQRVLAAYGNDTQDGTGPGLVTRYAHDPATFRLTRLRTAPMAPAGDNWTPSGTPAAGLPLHLRPGRQRHHHR